MSVLTEPTACFVYWLKECVSAFSESPIINQRLFGAMDEPPFTETGLVILPCTGKALLGIFFFVESDFMMRVSV